MRESHHFKVFILAAALCCAASTTHAGEALVINGITEPLLDVTLTVSVPGIIRSEPFDEGVAVKKGQVILELDKKLQEFEADKRKAAMEQAKSELESTRMVHATTKSVSDQELKKKETDYDVAVAEYDTAAEE